jgi:hypothetical protein
LGPATTRLDQDRSRLERPGREALVGLDGGLDDPSKDVDELV